LTFYELAHSSVNIFQYEVHIVCSKCRPPAETHEFRRLRKSLIALLIVVCGKSSQVCCNASLALEWSLALGKFVKCLQHCAPHMVVKWVEVGWIWWLLVLLFIVS